MDKSLLGRVKLNFSFNDKIKVINTFLKNNLTYEKMYFDKENQMVIVVKKSKIKTIVEIIKKENISVQIEKIDGLLTPILNMRHRLGIIIGAIILLLFSFISSKLIWKIEIEGNTLSSDEEILNELRNSGLKRGSYIPKIDYDTLHNKILLNSDNLSWISVNIVGNVAKVQVKERLNEEVKKCVAYSNLVAKNDGQIATVFVINGKKVINIGDVVKKGDLLVSGVIDSQTQGARYENAKGEVKAYVNKDIYIKIPMKTKKKIYTGEIIRKKSYKIFDFNLNFSSKNNKYTDFYDKIEKRESLELFGFNNLPIEKHTVSFYKYKFEQVEYSKDEACEIAFAELRAQMDKCLNDAELISRKINTYCDGKYYYLECSLYCLENIAEEQIFYVE